MKNEGERVLGSGFRKITVSEMMFFLNSEP